MWQGVRAARNNCRLAPDDIMQHVHWNDGDAWVSLSMKLCSPDGGQAVFAINMVRRRWRIICVLRADSLGRTAAASC